MKKPIIPYERAIRKSAILISFLLTVFFVFLHSQYIIALWGVYGWTVLILIYRIIFAYKQKCFKYFCLQILFLILITMLMVVLQLLESGTI